MMKKSDGQWRLYDIDGKNQLAEGTLHHVMMENHKRKMAKNKKKPKAPAEGTHHTSHGSHNSSHGSY